MTTLDSSVVDATALIQKLDELRSGDDVIAFDADGTLWSGDVGEDGFHRAVAERLFRDETLPAFTAIATRFSIEARGAPHEAAMTLWTAYTEGRFPEREMCEVMAWCYAGWSPEQLADYCRTVLRDAGLEARLHRELEPIIEWARKSGVRLIVVSASPRALVEAGAAAWGFSSADVIAATPALRDDRIDTRLVGPVPYAKSKCELAARHVDGRQWLASFGDNVFDIDMLGAARLGVAIRPKPALLARLAELPRILLLSR